MKMPTNNAVGLFARMFPGETPVQGPSFGQSMEQMIQESLKSPLAREVYPDDFLLEKTKSVRRLNETMLSYHGRVGLSPRQCAEWTIERITNFTKLVEASNEDNIPEQFRVVQIDRRGQTK
jgi:hypothetical protein